MSEADIKSEVETLARTMPEPFRLCEEADAFFARPAAQAVLAAGARGIVAFLRSRPNPPLARVAVMLLSRFPSVQYQVDLLDILRRSDEQTTLAFEPGLWMSDLDKAVMAKALVRLATDDGNPFPLLLLQRPAAGAVKAELESLVESGRQPFALYAGYALPYADRAGDGGGGT
jgi:hypothetical protein